MSIMWPWNLQYLEISTVDQVVPPPKASFPSGTLDSAMLGQVSTTLHDPFFLQNRHHDGDPDLLPSSAASLGYNFGSLKLQLLCENFEEIFS